MSLPVNYECEGQMSIDDWLNPDSWSGKTSPEHSVQTKEKTSAAYLKKLAELRIKPPMYLCLKAENGVQADASWETGGALLGVYTMHSFGESPSEERESRLSQILEDHPHRKYCLSARACQGILTRAQRRGKKLPEILEQALVNQERTLSRYGGGVERDCYGKKAGKGPLIQTELSATLGVSQDQTLIQKAWDGTDISPTLTAHNANGSQRMPDKENFNAVVCYGLDRASFNQGKNAQYDFSIEEDLAQTLVARGGGCCNDKIIGALCARDYKGVGSQYVSEGKCIIQNI